MPSLITFYKTHIIISIIVQQDSTLYSLLYFFLNCSTYFGWLFHPSSGAHITVITASGSGQTVSVTFCYRGDVGTGCKEFQLLHDSGR